VRKKALALSILLAIACVPAFGSDCDDLTISKDGQQTTCCVADTAWGTVYNSGSATQLACVSVWMTYSWNLATVSLSFGDDSDSWDGEDDLVTACDYVGADSSEEWQLVCTRDDWGDDAGATLVISYPCPRNQWLTKSVTVHWQQVCNCGG